MSFVAEWLKSDRSYQKASCTQDTLNTRILTYVTAHRFRGRDVAGVSARFCLRPNVCENKRKVIVLNCYQLQDSITGVQSSKAGAVFTVPTVNPFVNVSSTYAHLCIRQLSMVFTLRVLPSCIPPTSPVTLLLLLTYFAF